MDEPVSVNPRLNGACPKLKRIGQERNDIAEEVVSGNLLRTYFMKNGLVAWLSESLSCRHSSILTVILHESKLLGAETRIHNFALSMS